MNRAYYNGPPARHHYIPPNYRVPPMEKIWQPIEDYTLRKVLLPPVVCCPPFRVTFNREPNSAGSERQVILRSSLFRDTSDKRDFFSSRMVIRVNRKHIDFDHHHYKPLNITRLCYNDCRLNLLEVLYQRYYPNCRQEYCFCVIETENPPFQPMKFSMEECHKHVKRIFDKQRRVSGLLALHEEVSLMCPITHTKMAIPCRGKSCKHIQCFDARHFQAANENRLDETWKCPVCQKRTTLNDIRVDVFILQILKLAPEQCQLVKMQSNLTWETVKFDDSLDASIIDLTSDTSNISLQGDSLEDGSISIDLTKD